MDDLMPLTVDSVVFTTVFAGVLDRMNQNGITADVVRYINAEPLLLRDVYDYFRTMTTPEQKPDGSGSYQSLPVEARAGDSTFLPRGDDQRSTGTVVITSSAFSDAVTFVTTLSHELGGHYTERYINYYQNVTTPEQYAIAFMQGEANGHLRQAQNAEAILASGGTLTDADQTEVNFLQQARAAAGGLVGDELQNYLRGRFLDRLAQPSRSNEASPTDPALNNPYSRLQEAVENTLWAMPTYTDESGNRYARQYAGLDENGDPVFSASSTPLLTTEQITTNPDLTEIFEREGLHVKVTVLPESNVSTTVEDISDSIEEWQQKTEINDLLGNFKSLEVLTESGAVYMGKVADQSSPQGYEMLHALLEIGPHLDAPSANLRLDYTFASAADVLSRNVDSSVRTLYDVPGGQIVERTVTSTLGDSEIEVVFQLDVGALVAVDAFLRDANGNRVEMNDQAAFLASVNSHGWTAEQIGSTVALHQDVVAWVADQIADTATVNGATEQAALDIRNRVVTEGEQASLSGLAALKTFLVGSLDRLELAESSPIGAVLANASGESGLGVIADEVAQLFSAAQRFDFPPRDPLTFDLDGDGLETVGVQQSTVLFDHDGDGTANVTGWVKPDDGFLALDRDGNGAITSGRELFGDSTPLAGGGNAADGFAALAQEDTNADGVVNNLDARWSNLRIWRDLNQDGVSQAGELFSLDSLGISAINVAATEHLRALPDGNRIADLGTYVRANGAVGTIGTVGQMADIDLAEDTFNRVFTDPVPLVAGITALPGMQGSGKVRDLWEAGSLSPTLLQTLTDFSQIATRSGQLALLDPLLLQWAESAGLPTMDARAAAVTQQNPNGYVVNWVSIGSVSASQHQIGTDENGRPIYDAQWNALVESWKNKLYVLDAFNGRTFFVFPGEPGVGSLLGMSFQNGQGNEPGQILITLQESHVDSLSRSYGALQEAVYGALSVQSRLMPLLEQVVVPQTGALDFSATNLAIQARIDQNPVAGIEDLVDLARFFAPKVRDYGWRGEELLESNLRSLPVTPELQAVYNELRVTIEGNPGYTDNGTNQSDIMVSGAGPNAISGGEGNDIVLGGAGNDVLSGGAGDDALLGGDGNDSLYGGQGADLVIGGAGNDVLAASWDTGYGYAEGSPNVLEGGGGDDLLFGGAGSDTYRYSLGDGVDTINETGPLSPSPDTGVDRLVLGTGITTGDVSITRTDVDLFINFADRGRIRLPSWYNTPTRRIEELRFADGTLWDAPTLHAAGLVVTGTAGADSLTGLQGEDNTLLGLAGNDTLSVTTSNPELQSSANVLEGGTGNDILIGGGGADTYRYSLGDGVDTITETGLLGQPDTAIDKVVLGAGITTGDVSITRTDVDLFINFADGGRITLPSWYNTPTRRMEELRFADGTVWDQQTVHAAGLVVQGTAGADFLTGLAGQGNTLLGLAGNDTLSVSSDPQFQSSANVLEGGTGNDILIGGGGSDTYRYSLGDGVDTITEIGLVGQPDTAIDKVVLAAGITTGDVTITRASVDLFINFPDSGRITLPSWYNTPTRRIEELRFADGTLWNAQTLHAAGLVVHGTAGADTLYGLFGEANTLIGHEGNDVLSVVDGTLQTQLSSNVLEGGAGNDTLRGGGGADTYRYNLGDGQDITHWGQVHFSARQFRRKCEPDAISYYCLGQERGFVGHVKQVIH